MPGTKGYEFEDMRAFADWRADYIKIDWCNSTGQDITVSTAGLSKGYYHALVRADTVEPISGKPMSALYYDVDLEVVRTVRR